jgi:tRNA threonylcarbamoyladenosine biosynthesis protein TsaB
MGRPYGGGRPVGGDAVKLLAIETATDLVGAAVLADDGSVVERSHVGGRAHAELLAPAITEVCGLAGLTFQDLDALAVDIGPGLFTGLRVGVATAKALGQALGLGIIGVTSLDVLAAGARDAAGPDRAARVVSVVDARRSEVFAAAYDFTSFGTEEDPDPAAVCDDRSEALSPEDLVVWLDDLAVVGPVLVVGDGAVRFLELLAPRAGLDLGLADTVSAPSPAVVARLAGRRLTAGEAPRATHDVVPDYRRHADAKINWEERAPQRTALPRPTGTA